jgi:hypothetical protein
MRGQCGIAERSRLRAPAWRASLVGVAIAVLVAGCGGSGAARLSASRPLELSVGSPNRSRVPSALVVGPLVKGTYSTTRLVTRLTLTFDDGWNLANETPGELALTRGPLTRDAQILRFVVLDHAWQVAPPFVTDQETPADWIRRSHPAPTDYIGFLQGLGQYLDIGPLTTVPIAGRQATAISYTVARQATTPAGTCYDEPGPCFGPPSGVRLDVVSLPLGYAVRAAVVQGPDGPILVEAAAPDAAQLDELLADVDPILATMQLD